MGQSVQGGNNLLGTGGSVPPLANNNLSAYAPQGAQYQGGHITGGLSAHDKLCRELFVGNTPPGTSEALLMQFLNGAMRRVGLCDANATPILTCRTNQKFAFIELDGVDSTNKALNLNGIPFLGASLRVSRPSKYAGPHIPSQTWQQLTGQALPPGITAVPENTISIGGSPEEKLMHELFIGNTTPEMTGPMITDFLGRAMEQVGLTTMAGNPIVSCRVSAKFSFITLRTKEEATNALNLNNIPYLGTQLAVKRPTKYAGPPDNHGNWEDILAKFMSGELQLNNTPAAAAPMAAAAAPVAMAPAPLSVPAPAAAVTQQPSTVVELKQMLTLEDLKDNSEYEDILEDTREECSSFGTLKNIIIPRDGPGATKIFLEYMTVEDAGKAIQGLAGRTFDGRRVEAIYFDVMKFQNHDYSD